MIDHQEELATATSRDCSGRLSAAGMILVTVGLITGVITVLTPISLLLNNPVHNPAGNASSAILSVAIFGVATICFVWLGIGASLKLRWSWAWIRATSAVWLTGGVVTMLFYAAFLGHVPRKTETGVPISKGILLVAGLFYAIPTVVVPGIVLLLSFPEAVGTACKRYDPHARWTDSVPHRVLALLVAQLVLLVFSAGALVAGVASPKAGNLSNPTTLILNGIWCVALLLAAFWTFRRKIRGWWICFGLAVAVAVIYLIKPRFLHSTADAVPLLAEVLMLLTIVAVILFLLWVKPYMPREAATTSRR